MENYELRWSKTIAATVEMLRIHSVNFISLQIFNWQEGDELLNIGVHNKTIVLLSKYLDKPTETSMNNGCHLVTAIEV